MKYRPEGWAESNREWYRNSGHSHLLDGVVYEAGADAMLKAVCEEIEKGLLTEEKRKDLLNDYIASGVENRHILISNVAQAQLEKILTLLKK